MAFPFLAAALAGGLVLGVILAPKKAPAQPPTSFQRPKSREGDPIPVIWGTVDIREPQVVDFGDTKVEPNYVSGGGKK